VVVMWRPLGIIVLVVVDLTLRESEHDPAAASVVTRNLIVGSSSMLLASHNTKLWVLPL
jgi:hypothetical protein